MSDIFDNILDGECSDGDNLEHVIHIVKGYRDYVLGNSDCPYSSGSARQQSWAKGFNLAKSDTEAVSND